LLGLRPALVDFSEPEVAMLKRFAVGARCAVQIGVFEGASAAEIRSALAPGGKLVLVDPYEPGRLPGLNLAQLVARRLVGRGSRGEVIWIRKRSPEAARGWREPIDFLHLDGEHTLEGVHRDWAAWSQHVRVGGSVALHSEAGYDPKAGGPSSGEVVRGILRKSPGWRLAEEADTVVILQRQE
jgi:hypothetical protein